MADLIQEAISQILASLTTAVSSMIMGLPNLILGLIVAIIFIIIGALLGDAIKKLVEKVLNTAKLDEWAKEHKLKESVGGVHLSELAGTFIKWYIILIFLTQAAEFVALGSLRTFMLALVYYIPIVLAALIIVVLGLLLAKFLRNKIEATNHKYKRTIAVAVEILVIYLAAIIGLRRVGIDVSVLEQAFLIAFTAFVLVVALILGISFGLAFKNDVKALVQNLKREVS